MDCTNCGHKLEKDWLVCPFCLTPVPQSERQEERADCYEAWESLSPLSLSVRQRYEERRREEEREAEAARRGQQTERRKAEEPEEEVFTDATKPELETVSVDTLKPELEAVSVDMLKPELEAVSVDMLKPEPETGAADTLKPEAETVDPHVPGWPAPLILQGFVIVGCAAVILLTAFYIFEQRIGLRPVSSFEEGIIEFIRYLSYAVTAVVPGSGLGLLIACLCLRRIPLLRQFLTFYMSFARKLPLPLFLLLVGYVDAAFNADASFIALYAGFGLWGTGCLGSRFYERGRELFPDQGKRPSVREFARLLWRQGVPGIGREVRWLYHGSLAAGMLRGIYTYTVYMGPYSAWGFTMTLNNAQGILSVFCVLLMVVFEFLFAGSVRAIDKRVRTRDKREGR